MSACKGADYSERHEPELFQNAPCGGVRLVLGDVSLDNDLGGPALLGGQ